MAQATLTLGKALRVVEQAVTGRTFILGTEFSTADVMIGSTLAWAQMMGMIGSDLPAVAAYLGRLATRPAFQRASAD